MSLRVLQYDQPDDRAAFEALADRLRQQVAGAGQLAEQVAAIVEDVRTGGDEAVVKYMRQWTNPSFTADMIRVKSDEMAAAEKSLDPKLRDAMQRSIAHVREYQSHILPSDPPTITIDDCQLGLRFTPIQRVGLHVPGGKAAYPSSVIMLAVPAQVAGVPNLSIVSPPPTANADAERSEASGTAPDISPLVLAVCHMLQLDRVYRIGGAQAIAALTFGTESVDAVDFIAGPGNAYTQQAKRQLFGRIGIDGFFGPSEVVILADDSADPAAIAADLLAQAEHDPGCCFLVSTSRAVIDNILAAIEEQLPDRKRRAAIEPALRDWSAAIVVDSDATAYQLVDTLAAEHVTLAVADPHAALAQINHGGAFFLGDGTPVASGDYYAGPSHCLPTGTTARFTSGLSVYTFLKRSSLEHYPARPGDQAIADIVALAEAEGLDAHAESLRRRTDRKP
ncbi:histidinol dehydrogenase [Planctomycetales bacterium ZRK34]|nr:histidinol dehydrogenase [Planctomycetales bacterium ZRK34]